MNPTLILSALSAFQGEQQQQRQQEERKCGKCEWNGVPGVLNWKALCAEANAEDCEELKDWCMINFLGCPEHVKTSTTTSTKAAVTTTSSGKGCGKCEWNGNPNTLNWEALCDKAQIHDCHKLKKWCRVNFLGCPEDHHSTTTTSTSQSTTPLTTTHSISAASAHTGTISTTGTEPASTGFVPTKACGKCVWNGNPKTLDWQGLCDKAGTEDCHRLKKWCTVNFLDCPSAKKTTTTTSSAAPKSTTGGPTTTTTTKSKGCGKCEWNGNPNTLDWQALCVKAEVDDCHKLAKWCKTSFLGCPEHHHSTTSTSTSPSTTPWTTTHSISAAPGSTGTTTGSTITTTTTSSSSGKGCGKCEWNGNPNQLNWGALCDKAKVYDCVKLKKWCRVNFLGCPEDHHSTTTTTTTTQKPSPHPKGCGKCEWNGNPGDFNWASLCHELEVEDCSELTDWCIVNFLGCPHRRLRGGSDY